MISKYLNLVKFSHTIFAMPFALIGFVYALKTEQTDFNFITFLGIIACMIFARNAAMAFNRFVDRDIDAKNERTATREIPAGILSPKKVKLFIIINCLLFVLTTFFINTLTLILSPVALAIILAYSLTKRFTWLCHIILGLSLAIAPTAAYISVTGHFSWVSTIFSLIVLFWVSAFDILYALQDEEFDANQKLFSIPSYFGRNKALIISALLHLIAIILVYTLYFISINSMVYLIGATIFSALLVYEHLIVKPNDISKVNLAFATTNGLGSIVYATFTIIAIILIYTN